MREKKVLKKWMAFALVCALMISAIGFDGAISAQAEDGVIENLIVNGDFDGEDGIDASGWTPGEQEIVKEPIIKDIMTNGGFDSTSSSFSKVSGNGSITIENNALKVTTTDTTGITIGKGSLLAVAGTTYTITYKVKVSDDVYIQSQIVERGGANATFVSKGAKQLKASTEWQEMDFGQTVTAKSAVTSWDLRFIISGKATSIYIDDIKITYVAGEENKIKEIPISIVNSDFENDKNGWTCNANSEITTESAHNGTQALGLICNQSTSQYGEAAQWIYDVEPNTTYRFTFWTKVAASSGNITSTLRIYEYDASKVTKDSAYVAQTTSNTTTEWKLVSYELTTTSTTERFNMRLYAHHMNRSGAAGTCYFDGVSVVKIAPVYGDGITLNGTDYEMQLSDGNSAVYSGAEFTTNAWYRYSYDVVADETLTKAGLKVGNDIKTATSGTFKYVDGQEIGFGTAGQGKAYFDNLIIQKISGTGELITNGTFDVTDEETTNRYAGWHMGAEEIISRGNNLVSNGGFQTTSTTANVGAASWNRRKGAEGSAICIDDEDVSGNKVLKVSYASGSATTEVGMSSYIALKPSTEYEISFRLKVFQNENANERYVHFTTLAVVKGATTTYPQFGDVIYKTTNNDWQNITLTYTTPSDLQTSSNFLLYFRMESYSGTAYVDDVQLYQKAVVTQNTPVVGETTAQGIAGVDLSGDQCYLETEVAETQAGVSYILTMNTAGSGEINLINDGESETIWELTGDTVTAQKYLVSSPEATSYKLRFKVDGQNTTLSLGNVSMYMNRGDFDSDNDVEEDDFDTMREALLGIADTDALSFCDLTGDGVGTVTDLIRMKLYAVGIK